tara:strand:+ start:372 stop:575 length:204 start_codon:yes stop_codon:yes gene_type:complete
MLKVRDYPNLQRDPKSKAIVNVNQASYNEHLQKNIMKEKISHIDNEINSIKDSVKEIKNLLTKLVDK